MKDKVVAIPVGGLGESRKLNYTLEKASPAYQPRRPCQFMHRISSNAVDGNSNLAPIRKNVGSARPMGHGGRRNLDGLSVRNHHKSINSDTMTPKPIDLRTIGTVDT
jgi:hypothetical protein